MLQLFVVLQSFQLRCSFFVLQFFCCIAAFAAFVAFCCSCCICFGVYDRLAVPCHCVSQSNNRLDQFAHCIQHLHTAKTHKWNQNEGFCLLSLEGYTSCSTCQMHGMVERPNVKYINEVTIVVRGSGISYDR